MQRVLYQPGVSVVVDAQSYPITKKVVFCDRGVFQLEVTFDNGYGDTIEVVVPFEKETAISFAKKILEIIGA